MVVSSLSCRCLQALLVLVFTFLIGCSRSTNITDPAPFPDTSLPDCEPEQLRPDVALLTRLNVLANVDAPQALAGLVMSPSFDASLNEYRVEVNELTDSVTVVALPVIPENSRQVESIEMRINDELVEFGLASNLVQLPLPRPKDAQKTAQTVQVRIDLVAKVKPLEQIEGCNPGAIDPTQNLTVTERYRINIARKTSGWGLSESVEGSALVAGSVAPTSGEALNPYQQGQAPLDVDDEFGAAIALYGSTMAVGVPGDDNGDAAYFGTLVLDDSNRSSVLAELNQNNTLSNSGAVYIFERRSNGSWQLVQIIKAAKPNTEDRFGQAIAMHGNTLVIAAPNDDSSASGLVLTSSGSDSQAPLADRLAPNSGIVYVYERQDFDPTWRQVAYIKPEKNEPGLDGFDDAFGQRLVLSGDWLAIAAHQDDGDAAQTNSGTVSLYQRDGDWRFKQLLTSPLRKAEAQFGFDLALNGDALIIGAPGDAISHKGLVINPDSSNWFDKVDSDIGFAAPNSGAAYYYAYNGNAWGLKAFVKAENADANDRFGHSVGLSGFKQFLIGAPGEDGDTAGLNRNMGSNDLLNSGAAYRYYFSRTPKTDGNGDDLITMRLSDYIKSKAPAPGQAYGSRVIMNANLLAVAAPLSEFVLVGKPASQGVVELYRAPEDSDELANIAMTLLGQVVQADALTSESERFGSELALLNGQLLISAPGSEFMLNDVNNAPIAAQNNTGAVYFYE